MCSVFCLQWTHTLMMVDQFHGTKLLNHELRTLRQETEVAYFKVNFSICLKTPKKHTRNLNEASNLHNKLVHNIGYNQHTS
jgi:hypothetical protein